MYQHPHLEMPSRGLKALEGRATFDSQVVLAQGSENVGCCPKLAKFLKYVPRRSANKVDEIARLLQRCLQLLKNRCLLPPAKSLSRWKVGLTCVRTAL